MKYLIAASLIWAFSFGLSKELSCIAPNLAACLRIGIATLVFLPLVRIHGIRGRQIGSLLAIGAIQFGLTYTCYFEAFQYLHAHEVAICAVTIPLYVTLINDFHEGRFNRFALFTAALSVLGALIARDNPAHAMESLRGFLWIQVSNACFAFGQLAYRRVRAQYPGWKDGQLSLYLFMGAFLMTALMVTLNNQWGELALISGVHWLVLGYLGAIGSGLAFFFWNKGAAQTAPATLAVINNLKVPLSIGVSLWIFGEQANWVRLLLGGGLITLAIILTQRHTRSRLRLARA